MIKMKKLPWLFIEFFRLGLVTFGGGIAMLPVIKATAVKHHWIEEKDWEEVVTLSQLAPGAIAVNCANLIGYRARGLLGSIIATLGMILPPIIIITMIALGFEYILDHPFLQSALRGMFIVVFLLFTKAILSLSKLAWKQWWMVPFSLFSFSLAYFNLIEPGLILLLACVVIMIWTWLQQRKFK
jgi:chromate transporter